MKALRAWNLVGKAAQHAREHRLDEALAAVTEAVALCPDAPGPRLQLALIHLDRDEPAAAIETLSFPHDARQPAWPVFLGLAHADAGDLVGAGQHLADAVRLAPENRIARGLQAVLLLREGKPRAALDLLDRWGIEASPRLLGRLLVEIERTLIRLGAAEGGRLRAQDATDASDGAQGAPSAPTEAAPAPWDPPVTRQGLLDRGVGALVDPLFALYHAGRAERALLRSRPEQALREAREAVRRYPDIPRGFCLLGLAYLQQEEPLLALQCLKEAARRDGETPDVLYAQGCCHHEMGELDQARRCLQKMLAAFAKDAAAHYTLGQIDLEQHHEREARQHFEQAAFLDFLLVRERVRRLATALEQTSSAASQP